MKAHGVQQPYKKEEWNSLLFALWQQPGKGRLREGSAPGIVSDTLVQIVLEI